MGLGDSMRMALGGLLIATLGACGSESAPRSGEAAASPSTFNVIGKVTLAGSFEATANAGGCQGTGGYNDFRAGTNVVVRNDSDKKIALGELDEGDADWLGDADQCVFTFTLGQIPDNGGDIFSIEIGHREPFTFSKEESERLSLELR